MVVLMAGGLHVVGAMPSGLAVQLFFFVFLFLLVTAPSVICCRFGSGRRATRPTMPWPLDVSWRACIVFSVGRRPGLRGHRRCRLSRGGGRDVFSMAGRESLLDAVFQANLISGTVSA